MSRLPTIAVAASFAATALDDSPALSLLAGVAIAVACLFILRPVKER